MDDPNFKGFMANNTHANWNALRKIFGFGDPTIAMFGKEHTCPFHQTQYVEKILEIIIRIDLQDDYRKLCNEYRESKTDDELQAMYVAI